MAARKRKKVAKYRKPLNINIGMIVFGIIMVYIVISVIMYLRSDTISIYEVREGNLAIDNSYTGLILREESIEYAESPGYINYYGRTGEKVGTGSTVYTIDESGKLSTFIEESSNLGTALSEESLRELQEEIKNFSNSYHDIQFHTVYDFKYSLEGKVLQLINSNLLSSLNMASEDGTSGSFQFGRAKQSGVLSYSIDGLEGVTAETFTPDMLEQKDYSKTLLNSNELIGAGDPVYKLITNENWTVLISMTEERAAELASTEYIQVKFLKDNTTAWAGFSILNKDGAYYGKLDFNNSMIRYSSDRYVELKLITNEVKGLKIPVSTVVEKSFYTIPVDYFTQGGNNNTSGVIAEVYDEEGNPSSQFMETTVYYSDGEVNYVDKDQFQMGGYIIKTDSAERYQIGSMASLAGVYNINKGYAVFKQINILYENEEYCIIEKNSSYGLALYDHIVLDGSTVEEHQIVFN